MKNKPYLREIIVLFTISLHVHLSFGTRIYPDVFELITKKGSKLTLNCTSDEPVQWSFPKESMSYTKKVENGKVENGTKHDIYYSNLTIFPTLYFDTGYFICRSENNASNAAQIYVYCSDKNHALAASSNVVDAAMYDRAEIPCRPISPNISVILTRSTVNVEPIEKYDPKIGFIISTHSIIGSATFHCYAPEYRKGSMITVRVHPPHNGSSSNPHIEAFNSNFKYPIFENQNATINCSVITSIYTEIKSLEWQFPKNVEKKIIIGDITNVKHDARKFIAFFQSLSINNVTEEDQGNYSCKVVDGDSRTKVSTYSLQIANWNSTFLNVVPEKSDTVTVRAGPYSSVELVGTIEAFPNRTTRTWYDSKGRKINDWVGDNKHDVINEKHKTKLRINSVELKDLGIYNLKVNNSLRTITLKFTVIVENKPLISKCMENMSRFLNPNVTYTFECLIHGYPLPQIRWSVINCNDYPTCANNNVQYLPISQHKEERAEVFSVRSMLYIELNQSMRIQIEANNSVGSASSASLFLLTDYGTDVVLRENYTKPITIGDDIELTCAASKYAYADNFTWFFEKNKIVPSQGTQTKNYATNFSYVSTLSIKDIQKNHSGMYFCRTAFNDSSESDDIFEQFVSEYNKQFLTVEDINRPFIVRSNMNGGALHVVPGTLINFMIQVDGLPPPVVVWYKDGKPLSFNNHITLNTLDNGYLSLSIVNASREDKGVYSFLATNKGGNVADKLQLIIKGENEQISVDSGSIVEKVYFNYIFGFSIFFFLSLAYFVLWLIRRLNKEKKKLQKKLEEYGLEQFKGSAIPSLDPNLDITEQTSLIPYNEKYEFPRENLELGDVLGFGVFGIVRKAEAVGIIEKNVRTTVAVKVAKNQHESLFVKALASELKIMIYLGQHLNVVNLLGACTKDLIKGELAVIVEYCKYGNLRNFLLNQRNNFVSQIRGNDEIDFSITTPINYENIPFHGENGTSSKNVVIEEKPSESDGCLECDQCDHKLREPENRSNYLADYGNVAIRPIYTSDLICWSFQTALGMDYLASRKILHGDLAARNILLAEGFVAKICDFGFAKSMYQNQEYQCSKTILPVKWMAIESIEDRVFSTQSDVWAFGVTMWEIFSLAASPYPGVENATDLYEKLVSGYRMGQPKFATSKIYCLMKDCWNHCPQLRPSFTELCEKIVCIVQDSVQSPNTEENEK